MFITREKIYRNDATKVTSRATDENEREHEQDRSLIYVDASLLATVLEDAITQIRILDECNSEIRIAKTMFDLHHLKAVKYGVEQPPVSDELADIDHSNLTCEKYKIIKLESDRRLFEETLMATYVDLSVNKTFQALTNYLKKSKEHDEHKVLIVENQAKYKAYLRELSKQLRQQRNHYKAVVYDTNCFIESLKSQVEDAGIIGETQGRYVDNWQRARTEQHLQSIQDKECGPIETINYYKLWTEYEQRVHSEVDLLVTIAINETLQKVEDWMDKYDKDIENIDLKIQIKKNEYQDVLDTRIGLENTIENHDQMMKEWIKFKDDREKARLYAEKMTNSAIIVQAWWRGLLVRLQLGPYKVAKKKGGPGGKKK